MRFSALEVPRIEPQAGSGADEDVARQQRVVDKAKSVAEAYEEDAQHAYRNYLDAKREAKERHDDYIEAVDQLSDFKQIAKAARRLR